MLECTFLKAMFLERTHSASVILSVGIVISNRLASDDQFADAVVYPLCYYHSTTPLMHQSPAATSTSGMIMHSLFAVLTPSAISTQPVFIFSIVLSVLSLTDCPILNIEPLTTSSAKMVALPDDENLSAIRASGKRLFTNRQIHLLQRHRPIAFEQFIYQLLVSHCFVLLFRYRVARIINLLAITVLRRFLFSVKANAFPLEFKYPCG